MFQPVTEIHVGTLFIENHILRILTSVNPPPIAGKDKEKEDTDADSASKRQREADAEASADIAALGEDFGIF